jgi:hypothetical protein
MEIDFAGMQWQNVAALGGCHFSLPGGCSSVGGDWRQYFWNGFRSQRRCGGGANLTLVNAALQTAYQATSDRLGFYSFPNLPVGHYDLTISASGFGTQRKADLMVDTDSALRVDTMLEMGARADAVTVTSDTETQVDSVTTHLGEVISGLQMTALPLNGRSYTDLLSIQPGVAPISTLLPSSVIMAGVTGASILQAT